MLVAPAPLDEPARLELLRSLNILDTTHEVLSDAIAVAAASIANTPISAISLVDCKRQWFKAACGLGVRETHRDISFCAHVVLGNTRLIVPDAREDRRFKGNPLVTGAPYIRFYAGFPLMVEGRSLGALCVIDALPRALSASQIARLEDLTALASDWISRAAERASL